MLRILWGGAVQAAYIPEVLVRMRMGGMSNKSLFNMVYKSVEDLAALRQNGVGAMRALVLKNITKLPQYVAREPSHRLMTPETPRGTV
jgi:glycosyltransferase